MYPPPDKNTINLISPDIAWRYKVIPVQKDANAIVLLIDEAVYKPMLIGELEVITGFNVKLVKEKTEVIDAELTRFYRKDLQSSRSSSLTPEITANTDDFLLKVIGEAKALKSSDIHIEGYAEKCRIRLRIDGRLVERYHIAKANYAAFINKIKIKASLDIAEKRLPQDGRILIGSGADRTDIRVSVLPSMYGEKIVLRLLGTDASHISLENVGFDQLQLADFLKVLKKQQGIILISGPTGSGKTTTLYATLKLLNKEHNNILTVEDPIEYTLDGINQVQVRENIGLTFAGALRTFLRQDPDIIMLGEIRDVETAQMAIRASLTGHLVLSTIHTNSAWGIISRLIDMGLPPFLIANTLNMAMAQRLVRKLCSHCKKKIEYSDREYVEIKGMLASIETVYEPCGCDQCYFTGYSGRHAIYEVIPIDRELQTLIKANEANIDEQLVKRNIRSLHKAALSLVQDGITSIEEIYPILLNVA